MSPKKTSSKKSDELDDQITDLERKRFTLKSKLSRFSSFLNTLKNSEPSESKLIELDTRLKDIESGLHSEYNDVQFELEGIDFNRFQEDQENSFESLYYKTISDAKHYIFSLTKPPQSNANSMGASTLPFNPSKNVNIKLPVIELPKFSGQYDRWLEFKELFISLIHSADNLDPVQKLHYLRASLEGSAAQCIQCIELSGSNYELAWNVLCERFDNKRLMIHNYIKSLFSIPELKPDSSNALRNLVDLLSKNLRSLEALGLKIESWDPLIIYLVSSKLDSETIREWEQYELKEELPTILELKTFLSGRADFLEKVRMHKNDYKYKPNKSLSDKTKEKCFSSTSNEEKPKFSCYYCKKPHSIYKCEDFVALSLKDKKERIKLLKLCSNCLQKGHDTDKCRYGSCKYCSEKDNSLLHPNTVNKISVNASGLPDQTSSVSEHNTQITACNASCQGQVLLATSLVEVLDSQGRAHVCRALLDSASMSNFISKDLAVQLNLPQESINVSVSGIDEAQAQVSRSCDIQIKSLHSNFKTNLHCLVLSRITDSLPSVSLDPHSLNIPSYIRLADPKFYESRRVDLLLGASIFWKLLCKGTKQLGLNKPILQKSKLGWYISGPLTTNSPQITSCYLSKNIDLQSQISKFWEIEEISSKAPLSNEEEKAELHFQETFRRNKEGRFVVSIPLKEPSSELGESRQSAARQFFALEKRLSLNPKLKEMYTDFMNEYEELGHMSSFQPSEDQPLFYSPHHGVLREDSATTKLRVVFNSSSPSSSGCSYNSIQMVGPTVQEDLLSILLRFRKHSYVISADICKMYRQIRIADEFKPLQLILWRSSPEQELQTYSLDTVVYGTASAPFLSTRCLLQLSIDHQESHPQASEIIKRDFYVDDLLTGANSVEDAVHLCHQISSILASAGFTLRKWKSNSSDVLNEIRSSSSSNDTFYFGSSEACKTLGMLWSSNSDTLSFYIDLSSSVKKVTKRTILSETAKIFDPLGLISPVVVRAKIWLQKLWSLKIGWDEEIPPEIASKWLSFRSELLELNNLQVSRQATCPDLVHVELHGFSDASQSAYGACIYLRTIDAAQNIHVHLLVSKTRVAPLKSISIPRLELCAALLLAQLYDKVKSSVTLTFDKIHFWCDSTVVLAWIRSSPNNFQVFVGNRVAEIQRLSQTDAWRYVPTDKNMAYYLSRGVSPKTFVGLYDWFNGPSWLNQSPSNWPNDITSSNSLSVGELPEIRKNTKVFAHGKVDTKPELFPFNRFSSFTRIKRVMAYCLRFLKNCKRAKDQRQCNQLTVEELRQATDKLIILSQLESFPEDIQDLQKTGFVTNKSNLLSLTPFLKNDIIRVGGRLKHSGYSFEKKHPALLSPKHHLTYLIFKHEHAQGFHCGPQLLLSNIRENYWPISGKNIAKRIVRECVVCFRFKPRFINPLMGNLPEPRVSPRPPFSDVGVDYAGPFYYKDRKGRGGKILKCYLCLFICLTVKAVHLELVTDLSTSAFLEAFQRFIARRGKPTSVYSDNGSNFIGTNNHLKELGQFLKTNKNAIAHQLGNDLEIKWHFIAAYSPHHGGIWEAGIRSAKGHLLKVLSSSPVTLTFESFYTIVAQIENLLNSRPLTSLSTDPNDLNALTPSHFLIGRSSISFPYPDLESTPTNRLSHFELLEKLKQQFWKRWSSEYVTQLQQKLKWKSNSRNLSVGELVLVHDNDLPPYKWRLGRVSAVHPGTDGRVRVASVKTASGVIKRAVVKLAPLPIE